MLLMYLKYNQNYGAVCYRSYCSGLLVIVNNFGGDYSKRKTYFQVICDKKVHYMYIGELVAYNEEGVSLKFSDTMVCTYFHSEVVPFSMPVVEIGSILELI